MKKLLLAALLTIVALWGLVQLQPVKQAIAQTACTVRTPATLLGFFADNVPAYSITPSNVRDFLCTAFQLDNATLIPGCVGNGVTDDTTCVQNAMTAAASGGAVYLGPHLYAVSSTINITKEKVIGTQNGRTAGGLTGALLTSGFVGITANMNVLSITSATILRDLSVQVNGTPTSGTAITTLAGSFDVQMQNITIGSACTGMTINGNNVSVDHSMIVGAVGNTCFGILIGQATTGSSTVDTRITNTAIIANGANPLLAGMAIVDSEGLFLENNDILFSEYGTYILPGAGQAVEWLTAIDTVLGDTTSDSPLEIDANTTTSLVKGLSFTNTWTANNSHSPNIQIQNTGGTAGNTNGIWFNGHRSMNAPSALYDDVSITAGVTDVSFDSSHICGGFGTGTNGFNIASGVTPFALRNTELSPSCGGLTGTITTGVNIAGTTTVAIITGNQMQGDGTGIAGTLAAGSQIANNVGTGAGLTGPGNFTTLNASSNDAMLYYSTGGQGLTSSGTTITGWVKVNDRNNSNFSTSTGLFTVPVTGYYMVNAQLVLGGAVWTVGANFQLSVLLGATQECIGISYATTTTSNSLVVNVNCIVSAANTNTISIAATQGNGGTINLITNASYNYLSIYRIP